MSRRIYIFICFVALAINTSAAAWYVHNTSIQPLINQSQSGDTLYIDEGVYQESIVLKDGVAIIGVGTVILDGNRLSTRLITCNEDCQSPTLVQNLILQNARHDQLGGGAWLRGKVTMRHCIIRGCSGVQCGGVLIKGNLPEASALGATLEDCLIHNCSATGREWPDAGGVANFDGILNHCTIVNCYGDR